MDYEHKLKTLLLEALNQYASDIHIQVLSNRRLVEFRTLNGIKEIHSIKLSDDFIQYLKFRSNLDLFSLLKPQSSRIQIQINRKTYFIRVAYVRNLHFENFVLRIMNPPQELDVDLLFYKQRDRQILKQSLTFNSGLIVFSGSTGSGKTTSLYTCLKSIKNKKIYTIEDPIEFNFDFLIQLEVNQSIQFTFEEAIKQVLRHDPNVIVIGEIRDEREAKAAIRSALSGHLVLTTIHANDAESTLTRLREFGISEDYLKQVLKLIIYQELQYDQKLQKRIAQFNLLQHF